MSLYYLSSAFRREGIHLKPAGALASPAAPLTAGRDTRGLVAASPLFNAGVGLLTTAVLARILSFHLLGLYFNWTYTASILAIVAGVGLPGANAFFAAKHPETIASIHSNSLLAVLLSGLAGALVLHSSVAAKFTENGLGVPVLLAFTTIVPLSALVSALNGALLGSRKNLLFAALASVQVLTQFVGVVLILLLGFSPEESLRLALLVHALGFVIACVTALWMQGSVAAPRWSLLAESLRFGMPLWAHAILTVLIQRADVLILSFLLPPSEVGVYALASKLADSLAYLPQGLSLALFADFAQSTSGRASELAGSSIRLLFGSSIVLGVACYYGAVYLVPHLIPKVLATVSLLWPLLIAVAFTGPTYILLSCCQARGRSRAVLSITLLGFVSRSTLLLGCLRLRGLEAAPLAVLASSILTFLFALHQTARSTEATVAGLVLPARADARFAAALLASARRRR